MYLIPPIYIIHGGGLLVGHRVGVSPCSKILHTKTCGATVTHGRIRGWGGMVKRCCARVTSEILDFAKLSHLLLSPMLVREVTVLVQIYII